MPRSCCFILLVACAGDRATCDTEVARAAPTGAPGNVLVLVLDDIGVDRIAAYGVHPSPSPTPRIDALIAGGVRFDRAYASPTCSPTRASILTGRHPSRHGIGTWIDPGEDEWTLPASELTYAEVARDAGWSTGAVGKWHVASFDRPNAHTAPLRQGFDTFRGILGNPDMATDGDGAKRGYWHWERIDDTRRSFSDTYLTTAQVDDALALARTLPPPWVLHVAFSAAHTPLDPPPAHLRSAWGTSADVQFDAVVEALDAELGRLLDGIDPATTVVLVGDNGTPAEAIRPPWDPRAGKESMAEGGIRVPLAVAGPLAPPGTTSDALVHAVDVFATVVDLVGVDVRDLPVEVDGTSLVPLLADRAAPQRRCLWVEQFAPDGFAVHTVDDRAVIARDHKLVRRRGWPDALFRVGVDPSAEAASDDGAAGEALLAEIARFERALR